MRLKNIYILQKYFQFLHSQSSLTPPDELFLVQYTNANSPVLECRVFGVVLFVCFGLVFVLFSYVPSLMPCRLYPIPLGKEGLMPSLSESVKLHLILVWGDKVSWWVHFQEYQTHGSW